MKPNSLIYAVFTTPQNAIPGSAVCAFRIDDIIETFEGELKRLKHSTIVEFHLNNGSYK